MPHSVNDIDVLSEELISKSEIKREMLRLQDFGLKLVNLSKHQRGQLPLTDELKDAMILADKITNKHEALRRHIRYVAKLLAETDLQPIQNAMDVLANKHQQASLRHNKLLHVRDEMIVANNEAIENFLSEHPTMDRQKLRQLIRQCKKEDQQTKEGKYHRLLFEYLKNHLT